MNPIPFFIEFLYLAARIFPLLLVAVLAAEIGRLWLGEERLRRLLSGRNVWQGRLRAAFLGALLPFCECGAFPIMIGLLKAGVPLSLAITFFVISPIVSIPAFIFFMGIFGLQAALMYLFITVSLGILISVLLCAVTDKERILVGALSAERQGEAEEESCCDGEKESSILMKAWKGMLQTVKGIVPYAFIAVSLAALFKLWIPETTFQQLLNSAGTYSIPLAAAAGIPIYGADCTKISLLAPFMDVTGAMGPGVAFILAGAGTSINGLIFMSSIFSKKFLALFVLCIFFSAIVAGYALNMFW